MNIIAQQNPTPNDYKLLLNSLKFQKLAEALPQLVWTSDAMGSVDYVNESCLIYTGASSLEKFGQGWTNFLHPDDSKRVFAKWQDCILKRVVFEDEYRIRNYNGSYRWFLGRAAPILDDTNDIVGWVGSATDIHDQKISSDKNAFIAKASEELASSLNLETTLQTVAQLAVPVFADWCAVDLLDNNGQIKRLAAAHQNPEKVKYAYELNQKFPPRPESPYGVYSILKSGTPQIIEKITIEQLKAVAQNQEHYEILKKLNINSYIGVPLKIKNKNFGVLIFIWAESQNQYTLNDLDLAERIASRAAIAIENARLYQSLDQAVKMRDEFLSLASHELKTPLMTLNLYAELLKKIERANDQLSEKYLRNATKGISEQVMRMSQLIDNMLDVSRIAHQKLKLEKTEYDLSEQLQEIIDRHELQIQDSKAKVKFKADSRLVGKWDRHRLEQVFINLLTNALKYGNSNPIEITAFEDNKNNVVISIKDSGLGISQEKLPYIFNRFERAVDGSKYHGLGLGLYISKEIVDRHHGQIKVESEIAKGSTFTVILPKQSSAN